MAERYWHLKHCELLTQLPAEAIRRLESGALMRTFAAGAPIYLPTDAANGVLFLASGRIRICSTSEEGKRAILAYVDPGELFGELSLFGEGRRDELAEAMDESRVVLLPRDEFLRALRGNADFALGVTKLIGLRRQRIERRLKSLLFRSVRQRLVDVLLELAERYGVSTPRGTLIQLRLSHQELASAIGSTRESVTIILGEIVGEGLIENRRNRIVVFDLRRLAASAETGALANDGPRRLASDTRR